MDGENKNRMKHYTDVLFMNYIIYIVKAIAVGRVILNIINIDFKLHSHL